MFIHQQDPEATVNEKKKPALDQVLLHLVRTRLFLPLFVVSLVAIGIVGFVGEQTLENQQHQLAQSKAQMVDSYLDQANRMLDAVGRVAEVSTPNETAKSMQGIWEAYGYFDTLYYLDKNNTISRMVPSDPRYLGLEIPNLPLYPQTGEIKNISISRPFISLRTGYPTVYVIRPLSAGGTIVGELNLNSLQQEILGTNGESGKDFVFVMDQSGMLLAHPSVDLVRQQTNQGNLEIFRRGLNGEATQVYDYGGTMVLGSAVRVDPTNWVVIDQIPLSVALGPYVWTSGLTFLASILIWLALAWNLRKQLHQTVINPLVQLSEEATALATGDLSQDKTLALTPSAFIEMDKLKNDFQYMSSAIQKRQAALQESEERYRALFRDNPSMFFTVSAEGKVIAVNQFGANQLGYTVNELEGQSVLKVFYPEDQPSVNEQLKKCLQYPGQIFYWQLRKVRKDNSVLWVEEYARAVSGLEGSLFVLIVCQDITKRKLAEEILRDNQFRLEDAMDQGRMAYWEFDVSTKMFTFNDRFYALFGTTADREGGYRMPAEVYAREFVHPDESDVVANEIDKCMKTSDPGYFSEIEHRIVRRGGEVRHIVVRLRITKDGYGNTIKANGVNQDITERKRAEDAVLRKNEELSAAYEEITATAEELKQNYDTLNKSQQALEQARRKLNILNSITFSDIQNAIFSLSGYLELETTATLDEKLQQYLDKQIKLVQTIIESLKFASNYQNLGLRPPAWQNVNQAFLFGISHLDISKLSRTLNVEGLEIYADPLLEDVFFTLAENVILHGKTAKVITLRYHESPEGLTLFFEDNGVGIQHDLKEKIFDRKYEEKKGMGLFLAREILSVTGITIRETGEPGNGARFEITVPKGAYRFPDSK
jgi:PAS domain S-box-containing protein